MKKNLLLLFLMTFVGIFSAQAYDFSVVNDSGYTIFYNILDADARTVAVADASPISGDLEIPATVTYNGTTYTVTEIAYSGLRYGHFTSIVLPNTITAIDRYAFYGNDSLTSCVLPSSLTSVGENAFSYCSAMTSFVIPASLTSIGDNAFNRCVNITSIVVDEGNPVYDSRGNCNAIIITDANKLYLGCKVTTNPSTITEIGDQALYLTDIEQVTIPANVNVIGGMAFSCCPNLASIIVEDGNSVYDSRDNCNCIIETATNTL